MRAGPLVLLALLTAGCGGEGSSEALTVANRIDVGLTEDAYAGAGGVAVDGEVVWATKPNEGELIQIDRISGEIRTREHVCNGANDVAVGSDAVYVACEGDEEVLELDREGKITGRADVGVKALGLAVGGGGVWVSNREFDDLVRVDPASMQVTARIDTGRGAWAVEATDDAVWVTTQGLEVVRVDPGTNEVVARIPTVTDELSLSLGWVAAGDESVWLTSADALVRLDPRTNTLATVIDLGEVGAGHVAVADGRVWVSATTDVVVVDEEAESVSGELTVTETEGTGLRGISPSPNGAWVVNPTDGQVVEIDASDGTVSD